MTHTTAQQFSFGKVSAGLMLLFLAAAALLAGCNKTPLLPGEEEQEGDTCSVTLHITTAVPSSTSTKADGEDYTGSWGDMGWGAAGGYAMTDLHVFVLHERGNGDTTFVAYKGVKFPFTRADLEAFQGAKTSMETSISFKDLPRGTHLFYIVANTASIPNFWGKGPGTGESGTDESKSVPDVLEYYTTMGANSGTTAKLSSVIKAGAPEHDYTYTTYDSNGNAKTVTTSTCTEYTVGTGLANAKTYIGYTIVPATAYGKDNSNFGSTLSTLMLETGDIRLSGTDPRRSNHYRNGSQTFGEDTISEPWGQPLSAVAEYTPTESGDNVQNELDVKLVRTGAKISTSLNNMTTRDIRLDKLLISDLDAGNGFLFGNKFDNSPHGVPPMVTSLGDVSSTPPAGINIAYALGNGENKSNIISSGGLILYESGDWTNKPTLTVRFTLAGAKKDITKDGDRFDASNNAQTYTYFWGPQPMDDSGNLLTTWTGDDGYTVTYGGKEVLVMDSYTHQNKAFTELRRNTYLTFNIDIYKGDTAVACEFNIKQWEEESEILHEFK